MKQNGLETLRHQADVCVVGGGLAGLCAALSSARHGAKTLLMQDRPVLGGNASSEIRMWICGAHGDNNRETGIVEELLLENQYLNPEKNYSLWDSVLLGAVRGQENLEVLLNCACMDGQMAGNALRSITGFQLTTQRFHQVDASIFIDCSGDSILAPITGASFRMGREGHGEFGESIAPAEADRKTMGMSCLLQARKESTPSAFTPPAWARKFTKADLLPYRVPNMESASENYWYLELGGEDDAIRDTESLRDTLVAEALGLWDYIKNDPENKEKNACWHLDWMGFLPGKRESRRYEGAYLMRQQDVESGGHFPDLIAYGGWTMDDHHPAGLRTHERPTIFHPAPSPFGIPYGCLYSREIPNLMFAGRNISVTHSALSATRVMATCGVLGQAAGTAAALAIAQKTNPDGVARHHIHQLRCQLMEDDCYLPYAVRPVSALSREADYSGPDGDAGVLKNGLDRPIDGADNGLMLALNAQVEMRFAMPREVAGLRLVFDSDLNRDTLPESQMGLYRPMLCNRPGDWFCSCVPKTLTRAFRIDAKTPEGWRTVYTETNNYQRLVRAHFAVPCQATALRFVPLATWGMEQAHVFSVDIL